MEARTPGSWEPLSGLYFFSDCCLKGQRRAHVCPCWAQVLLFFKSLPWLFPYCFTVTMQKVCRDPGCPLDAKRVSGAD